MIISRKGILFTSRPRKITFYYRYIPKNIQDYGEADFVVKDSQQNIIATKSFKFESQSSWTQESILLEYGVTKASSLCIIFKSTVNESCLERNSENFLIQIAKIWEKVNLSVANYT